MKERKLLSLLFIILFLFFQGCNLFTPVDGSESSTIPLRPTTIGTESTPEPTPAPTPVPTPTPPII